MIPTPCIFLPDHAFMVDDEDEDEDQDGQVGASLVAQPSGRRGRKKGQ
jgi:hypothetical protein